MELNLHDVCSNPKAVKLRSHEYPGNTSGCAGFVSQHWLRVCSMRNSLSCCFITSFASALVTTWRLAELGPFSCLKSVWADCPRYTLQLRLAGPLWCVWNVQFGPFLSAKIASDCKILNMKHVNQKQKPGLKVEVGAGMLQPVNTSPNCSQPLSSGTSRPEPLHLHTTLLKGSWDLVTRVIIKVTIRIITYNPK